MSKSQFPASTRRLLIVGAYGVVGEQIVELMATENKNVELWLAGRSQEKAAALASRFEGARSLRVDMDDADPLAKIGMLPDAVLAVANDSEDNLLSACVKRGIAYIDITRWTDRMLSAVKKFEGEDLMSPVILASAWMAGVVATVVADAAQKLKQIDRVEFDVLYALKDRAGPNSIEYVDRLRVPFNVMIDGASIQKKPFTDPQQVRFSGSRVFETMRFDTPDQYTLPKILSIPTVSGRIGYDDNKTMGFMKFMLKTGLWTLISRPMFDNLRRSLIYNPGPGAAHEIQLNIIGQELPNNAVYEHITISDPLGQTHMTAAGALLQVERVFGLHGLNRPPVGISHPEAVSGDAALGVERLRQMGVDVLGSSLVSSGNSER